MNGRRDDTMENGFSAEPAAFEDLELEDLEDLEDPEDLEDMEDFEDYEDDGLEESAASREGEAELEMEAYAAVLEGAYDGLYEAAETEAFLGGIGAELLRRIGKRLAGLLASWARSQIGQRLRRFGARAVHEALAILKEVASQTIRDSLRYASSRRVYSIPKLLDFAKRRFWTLLQQALARRGVRVSLEAEIA